MLKVVNGTVDDQPAIPTLEQLYRDHAEYVATVAYRLLRKPDDVDDIVHDVFLQANKSLPLLRDSRAARSWLATITVRVTRRAMNRAGRRWWRRKAAIDPDELPLSRLDQLHYELVHSVYAVLERLPVDVRIAWSLRRVHRAPLKIVAQMCGCSLATAKRRIAVADKVLEEGSI